MANPVEDSGFDPRSAPILLLLSPIPKSSTLKATRILSPEQLIPGPLLPREVPASISTLYRNDIGCPGLAAMILPRKPYEVANRILLGVYGVVRSENR